MTTRVRAVVVCHNRPRTLRRQEKSSLSHSAEMQKRRTQSKVTFWGSASIANHETFGKNIIPDNRLDHMLLRDRLNRQPGSVVSKGTAQTFAMNANRAVVGLRLTSCSSGRHGIGCSSVRTVGFNFWGINLAGQTII